MTAPRLTAEEERRIRAGVGVVISEVTEGRAAGFSGLWVDGGEVWIDTLAEPEDVMLSRDLRPFVETLRDLCYQRRDLLAELDAVRAERDALHDGCRDLLMAARVAVDCVEGPLCARHTATPPKTRCGLCWDAQVGDDERLDTLRRCVVAFDAARAALVTP